MDVLRLVLMNFILILSLFTDTSKFEPQYTFVYEMGFKEYTFIFYNA